MATMKNPTRFPNLAAVLRCVVSAPRVVAQSCTLLYRRFAIGRARALSSAADFQKGSLDAILRCSPTSRFATAGSRSKICATLTRFALICAAGLAAAGNVSADWLQLQGGALRSGNAPTAALQAPLGLVGAIPLTDAIFTSPIVSDGKIFVVDGSGVVFAIDAATHKELWRFTTRGGLGNCNNVATPAVAGRYLHVGTTAGYYYVFDKNTGAVVKEIDCQEPIFSAPAVGSDRVYFATLGARVYAVEPNGEIVWTWDFVKEVVQFDGNRWSGADWLASRKDRVTWRDHFVCSRDICLVGKTVVIPAGGRTVFLEDAGKSPRLRVVGEIPEYAGKEFPATFGQSADAAGNVYVQWHRRDNSGRLEKMRLAGDKVEIDFVKGTETLIRLPGHLSFSSVSIRGDDVYRVRPEQGLGLCRHTTGKEEPVALNAAGSIARRS